MCAPGAGRRNCPPLGNPRGNARVSPREKCPSPRFPARFSRRKATERGNAGKAGGSEAPKDPSDPPRRAPKEPSGTPPWGTLRPAPPHFERESRGIERGAPASFPQGGWKAGGNRARTLANAKFARTGGVPGGFRWDRRGVPGKIRDRWGRTPFCPPPRGPFGTPRGGLF